MIPKDKKMYAILDQLMRQIHQKKPIRGLFYPFDTEQIYCSSISCMTNTFSEPTAHAKRSLCISTQCGMHYHCSTSRRSSSDNVAARNDSSHIPAGLEYPRGLRLGVDQEICVSSQEY